MPGGIMISARQMQSMIGGNGGMPPPPVFGSSSGLNLGQLNPLVDLLSHHHSTAESVDAGRINRADDDEFDSKSGGSENPDGDGSGNDDQDPSNQRKRKKRYHRHTQHQIQEMEAFFKECPHPDDKQRKELSRVLGLEPLQIKFWFQNKRTQMKMQHERHENSQLRNENDKLRSENMRYRDAIGNSSCPSCGGPTTVGEMSFEEHHLRVENSRLREEIDRISSIAAKYVGKPVVNFTVASPPVTPRSLELGSFGGELYGAGDLLRPIGGPNMDPSINRQMVVELAVAAMEELTQMAQMGDPLWIREVEGSTYRLNEDEYLRTFPRGIGPRSIGFKPESSRDTATVIVNQTSLVEILINVNQWASVFSGIVSRAMTLDVLSTGVAGNYDGALQVMTAEFHVLSPVLPTREAYFVRYCKHHGDGTWAVVDVSLDSLRASPSMSCRRRPSGCLIQEMPNGYSKVTWIEHVEVDDSGVQNIYRPLVNSGLAFGAKRWLFTLGRQCERLASAMAPSLPPANGNSVLTSIEGKRSMMKLAERMVISFCGGVTDSTAHTWTTLSGSGAEDVRVMTRKSIDDPGRPPGIVLNATTSFWLPLTPRRVFDFLRDERFRNEWDILCNNGVVLGEAHIVNGRETGNCVSLLRVNTMDGNQNHMLILQECFTDPTGSYIIYAPVDIVAMNMVLAGGDPDYVPILPSGFSILPDGHRTGGIGEVGPSGSLLTVAFQILVDSAPNAKLSLGSVATVNSLISCTVQRIKASLAGDV